MKNIGKRKIAILQYFSILEFEDFKLSLNIFLLVSKAKIWYKDYGLSSHYEVKIILSGLKFKNSAN